MRVLALLAALTLIGCSSKSSRDVVEKDGGSGGSSGSGGSAGSATGGSAGAATGGSGGNVDAGGCEKLGSHSEEAGNPSGLGKGKACTRGSDCVTGYCVQGVCCNTICQFGNCQTCVKPGDVGTCSIAAPGTNPRCDCPKGCSGSPQCN